MNQTRDKLCCQVADSSCQTTELYQLRNKSLHRCPRPSVEKGTGSERVYSKSGENSCREVPVPLFQHAARPLGPNGAGSLPLRVQPTEIDKEVKADFVNWIML